MKGLDIKWMLTIDETGMPKAPTLEQLLDKDVARLYVRDKSPNKDRYIKEVGVIYYLGDPKGPGKQEGLSDSEIIKKAIENYDLPKDYQPDILVWTLAKRYFNERAGVAMEAVLNLRQGIHNIALGASKLNELLNAKLAVGASMEDVPIVLDYMKRINDLSAQLPNVLKGLTEAEENLLYEQENVSGRGGQDIISSMIEE